jgi:SAM-dependent methyltransferase
MSAGVRADMRFLRHLCVCPVCKGGLSFSGDVISCVACGREFAQSRRDSLNLLPAELMRHDQSNWDARQQEMEEWYRELITHKQWAVECFSHDYGPFSSLLARLTGTILDLGGGNGIVRHYLPQSTRYIAIDPSVTWLGNEWGAIAETFPCLRARPCFIRGVGEYLPFPAESFDAVLAFWSLNHASYPADIFAETYRVLMPAGRFIVSLEDMPPRWVDVLSLTFLAGGSSWVTRMMKRKVLRGLRGKPWPVHSDHLRIHESEIQQWIAGRFAITKRAWVKTYLTFEFRKV